MALPSRSPEKPANLPMTEKNPAIMEVPRPEESAVSQENPAEAPVTHTPETVVSLPQEQTNPVAPEPVAVSRKIDLAEAESYIDSSMITDVKKASELAEQVAVWQEGELEAK